MIAYDSFIRSTKIKTITGEVDNSLIEFLINVRDNGSYDLCKVLYEPENDINDYHYEYRYRGIEVFGFKYRYSTYDCVVSSYFISLFDKKYAEVYDDSGYGNNDISVEFFNRYIMEFLGYMDFVKKLGDKKVSNGL